MKVSLIAHRLLARWSRRRRLMQNSWALAIAAGLLAGLFMVLGGYYAWTHQFTWRVGGVLQGGLLMEVVVGIWALRRARRLRDQPQYRCPICEWPMDRHSLNQALRCVEQQAADLATHRDMPDVRL